LVYCHNAAHINYTETLLENYAQHESSSMEISVTFLWFRCSEFRNKLLSIYKITILAYVRIKFGCVLFLIWLRLCWL